MRIISQYKPDLILLNSDGVRPTSWTAESVRLNLLAAVKKIASSGGDRKLIKALGIAPWDVGRVALRTSGKDGLRIPAGTIDPVLKESYEDIGTELSSNYVSLGSGRRFPDNRVGIFYDQIFPSKPAKGAVLDGGFQRTVPPSLVSLDRNIGSTIKRISGKPAARNRNVGLLLPILRDIDRAIVRTPDSMQRERRYILKWKESLEQLRSALLGVTARWTLNYPILTERQLVEFRIESVANLPAGGQTSVLFPMAQHGWIVNETARTDFPLTIKEPYRLVTPEKIEYDLPAERYYQKRSMTATPISIILVHRGAKDGEYFTYRMTSRIEFAPRFTAEVITPIVRCIDGERLVMRLTNHSRDGVSDKLNVADSICYSNVKRVALSTKEMSSQDTLRLTWYKDLRDTSYLVPVEYGGMKIAQFLGRKFSAGIDTGGQIGVFSGWSESQTTTALTRFGVKSVRLTPGMLQDSVVLGSMRALIVDRRALTLRALSPADRRAFIRYANGGGHLIVLAQDAAVWNDNPLIDGIHLTPSSELIENMPIRLDTSSTLLSSPNTISTADFDGWLIRRAYNIITSTEPSVERPVVSENGDPLVLLERRGKGTIVYVDLALAPQLMNLNPGAMRLLANLVSQ